MDVAVNYQTEHFLQGDHVVVIEVIKKLFKSFIFIIIGIIANEGRTQEDVVR